jgi:hypothetical protein
MTVFTPVYGWPFQALGDPPDGPNLGEDLALAIEATMQGVQAAAAGAQSAVAPVSSLGQRTGCTLRRAAAQTLPDIATTAISWDTEDSDPFGMIAAPSTTLTIPAGGDGIWAIAFVVSLVAVVTGRSFADLTPTTTPWSISAGALRFPFSTGEGIIGGGATFPMVAGNTITVSVNADTAAGTTMTAALTAYRIGV